MYRKDVVGVKLRVFKCKVMSDNSIKFGWDGESKTLTYENLADPLTGDVTEPGVLSLLSVNSGEIMTIF